MRVLIVEDEQIVAADLAAKLKRIGHEVVGTAVSAEEALELTVQCQPHLVLMDVQLSGKISGIDAAQKMQKISPVKIIFVTAYAGIFIRDPAQMGPSSLCLSKPFSLLQLQTALDSLQTLK